MADTFDDLPRLKQVSQVKHQILEKYLLPWSRILGSVYPRLAYIDCFAGTGAYLSGSEEPLPGSPVIAYRIGRDYERRYPKRRMILRFIERDTSRISILRRQLEIEGVTASLASDWVLQEDAQAYLVSYISSARRSDPTPTFFFIDPYGYPVGIPLIRQLLALDRSEVFLNLMWYAINRGLNNPDEIGRINALFGHDHWQSQSFTRLRGWERERSFLNYFIEEIGAKFALPFRVHFSPEDRIAGKNVRTKYYLIHFSNHAKAAVLMKDVMVRASDSIHELKFSGRGYGSQLRFSDPEPDIMQLQSTLLERYSGRSLQFDELVAETIEWPFLEGHYRDALRRLERGKLVAIRRVTSKSTGIDGRDEIIFQPS